MTSHKEMSVTEKEDIAKSGVGFVLPYGVVVRFLGAPQNCGGSGRSRCSVLC
jgi:hypothetical protein